MNSQSQRSSARRPGRGSTIRWAMAAGGILWVIFGYFRFITPQGPDVMWREDLGYSLILSTRLFVLYNLPGVLALLLTSSAALTLLRTLLAAPSGLKRAAMTLMVFAAVLGLVAAAGQIVRFDPLTTGGLSFGTLACGLALFLAGLAAAGTSQGSGRHPRQLPASLMLLGAMGMTTLVLRPLMYALGLLPLVVGTAAFVLFGTGWIILGSTARPTLPERIGADHAGSPAA